MKTWPNVSFQSAPLLKGTPLHWMAIGEDRISTPKYNWAGKSRTTPQGLLWQTTLSGMGRIDIGSRKGIPLGPGASFDAHLPSSHRYYFDRSDPDWHFRYIMWRGPALESFFRASCENDVYILDAKPLEAELRKLKAIQDTESRQSGNPWRNVSDALEILLPVLTQANRQDLFGASEPSLDDEAIALDQLAEPIAIDPGIAVDKEGWAASQGLSRYQLYRRVKSQTGMSPKEVRDRYRLNEAIRYLRKPKLSIADAATLSGFGSQNYFSRFFKRQTGFSPTEWKRLFATGNGDAESEI